MKTEDISYCYNTKGYMMYYKGKPIGGAGIDKSAKGCRANLKLFRKLAEMDKQNLLAGHGSKMYLDYIKKIDDERGE